MSTTATAVHKPRRSQTVGSVAGLSGTANSMAGGSMRRPPIHVATTTTTYARTEIQMLSITYNVAHAVCPRGACDGWRARVAAAHSFRYIWDRP